MCPQVLRKVTTTVTEGEGAEGAKETCASNIFEFFDSKKTGDDWDIGYLYRTEPRISGQESYLMKFTEPITQDFVREKFGGHLFRVLLKKGPQRVCEGKMAIEAPPKMQTDNSNYNQQPLAAAPGNGDIARHAMDLVADPAKASIGIAMQTAQTGFDIVRAQMAAQMANSQSNQLTLPQILELVDRLIAARAPAAAASAMPDWLAQTLAAAVPALITGLVSKLVTPENPIETFKNLAGALQSMPGFGGGKGGSDWKASLVESLPQIAQAGTQMMHEWRVATEAAASTHPNRQLPPAPAAPFLVPTATVQNPNAPAPAPRSEPAPGASGAAQPGGSPPPPPEKWLKMKMVEMFRAGRSGEDVGVFLEEIAPMFVEQLAPVPPEQLQGFLRMDPDQILTQIADDPRMLQFLTEFHTWANEIDQAAAVAVATQKPA